MPKYFRLRYRLINYLPVLISHNNSFCLKTSLIIIDLVFSTYPIFFLVLYCNWCEAQPLGLNFHSNSFAKIKEKNALKFVIRNGTKTANVDFYS